MDTKLSRRLQQLAPSATLEMTERAREMRERGVDVIALAAGQPDFDTAEHIKAAANAALAAGDTKYPSPVSGKTGLRQTICRYLKRYCDLVYEPSQICVTVGAKDAIFMALAALLDPGDEVLIPVPYWVSYPDQVGLLDAKPVLVRGSGEGGLKITADDLRRAITPRTRVLVLNSPCNPTGAVYTRDELESLAAVLRDTDIAVISDEIYHRLVFDGWQHTSFAALPDMRERTITINGVSKSFAMTGWRLGFAAGPQPLIAAMARLQGQTTSGPASFVQTASIAALDEDQQGVERMRQAYQRRARIMCDALNAIAGVRCPPPHGAFYCFPDVSGTFARLGVRDADGFAEAALERAHVALVSGTPFGSPTHVRMSCATGEAQIHEGLSRLNRLLNTSAKNP